MAEKDGVIKTKIEPSADGRDQAEAFNALRRDIEIRLDRILCEVPGDSSAASGITSPSSPTSQSSAPRRCGSSVSRRPLATPPVQQGELEENDVDRIMVHNQGPPAYGVAVREWKTSDEKRG